jgi:CRISPR-associated endonuclease Csn1
MALLNCLNKEIYVIRKDLESIKSSDVENIVDEIVKEKVKEAKLRLKFNYFFKAKQKTRF